MTITTDISEVEKRMTKLVSVFSVPGMRKLGKVAKRELAGGISMAFSSGRDPATGMPWAARKESPTWLPLRKTGTLQRSLFVESRALSHRLFIKTRVRDNRSGGESYHAIAGALFYGRKDQREGIRKKGKTGKGGPMPPRPFAGFTRSGMARVRTAAKQLIRKTKKT